MCLTLSDSDKKGNCFGQVLSIRNVFRRIKIRDCSLITGRGGRGYKMGWGGGHVKFCPYENGGVG